MSQNFQGVLLTLSIIILGLGIGFAGLKINQGLQNFRSYDRSVIMKGLAEREVIADMAVWSISYVETGNDLAALQDLMDRHGKTVTDFLYGHGLKTDEVEIEKIEVQDLMTASYRQDNAQDNRYILTHTYHVATQNIDAADRASKNMGSLLRKGVTLYEYSLTTPTYLFTKLNEIKLEILAEATKNAHAAAKEFAKYSGQKVGGIKYASQGVFEILPRNKAPNRDEDESKHKTVRLVSTIEFYLED